jgi:hypothetical protein
MKSQKHLKGSNQIHSIKCVNKNSYFGKLFGISKEDGNVYFETRWGIHTFGLKKEITVLILDKDGFVVKKIFEIKPNRIHFWNPKFFRIVELDISEPLQSDILVGDQVILSIA